MKFKALFIAVLEDNTIFRGGNYYNTKWLEIPEDKKIKRIFYILPTGDYLCLDLYDTYYHYVEGTKDINVGGKSNLEYAYLMGKKGNNITCYKINLRKRLNKNIGDIEILNFTDNDSFIKELNPRGWK